MCLSSPNRMNFLLHSLSHSSLSTSWWNSLRWSESAPISRTSILKKNFPMNPHLVAMSLRWLAGVQWQDIETVYGVSICHFYYRWSKFWMRKCVAQPFKYGYQNHPMLKACSILLCSLRPLHHHQFWEDVLEPWMVRCCLLSFPQLQRQRMYVHLTRSLHAWRFERPGPIQWQRHIL